jgi:hypothetical protein
MKSKCYKFIGLFTALTIFLSSCSSTTMIESKPPGAKVYLNGMSVGKTPYRHSDTKIVGSSTSVKLELEGYETLNTSFSRDEAADVGAIIGGLFVLVPFLWTMKYEPVHFYELVSKSDSGVSENIEVVTDTKIKSSQKNQTKAEKLRELKQLLDEKIITQEEFEKEKKKILDGVE